jgi:hypothetical protein
MCELYLGATNSYATTPPNPFYLNPSIQSPTYTFTEGNSYPLTVVLQNADTTVGCSSALVNLYWSDPTTSFLIVSGNQIGTTVSNSVPPATPATTIPPAPQMDGFADFDFNWTPDATAASTNGGHVCLAAIAQCASSDCFTPAPCGPGQTATTGSALVAIHNTQVNPPAPAPPGPGSGRPGPRRIRPFFFGATNGGSIAGLTRIVARAYNPENEEDRLRILYLAGLPAVQQAYGRCMKFGTPAEVLLALGAESIIVPARRDGPAVRLGFTGPVNAEFADELVERSWAKGGGHAAITKEVELMPRQVQQVGVEVVPRDDDGRVYAIDIAHELVVKGAPPVVLGGLTVLFATSCRPW